MRAAVQLIVFSRNGAVLVFVKETVKQVIDIDVEKLRLKAVVEEDIVCAKKLIDRSVLKKIVLSVVLGEIGVSVVENVEVENVLEFINLHAH